MMLGKIRPRTLLLRAASAALALTCAGCAAEEAHLASQGKSAVLGYTQNQMRMCAGFPSQTVDADGSTIWSYKREIGQNGGLAVSTPLTAIPGMSQTVTIGASTATCSMQVRFVGGKVAEVAYAGDKGLGGVTDHADCAPLIRSCLGYRPR